MITHFSHGRVLTSAPHLARDLTVSGAFITPRLRQMHQQQAADQHPKVARARLPARMIDQFHTGSCETISERNHA